MVRAFRRSTPLCHVYVPQDLTVQDGKYDVLVHFHGVPPNQEANIARARLSAVVVSVNLGVGSRGYSSTYARPQAWERLMAQVAEATGEVKELEGARPGRVAVSAWSAGYASIKSLLDRDAIASQIDAVLVADGLFTSYADNKKKEVNVRPLERTFAYARMAIRGEKLFVVTHSRVPTFTYPTVEETTTVMLDTLRVPRARPSVDLGPLSMKPVYEAHEGGLHVYGYEGDKAGDHIAQIRAMGDVVYPLLAQRWTR